MDPKLLTNVIVIAHGFPGRGARGVGLLNRLPGLGFRLWVVTNTDPRREAKEKKVIESLHPSIKVIRAWAINRSPFRVFSKFFGWTSATRFFERLIFVPDLYVIWSVFAYFACRKLMRQQNIRAVITISPPESAHLVGLWLQRRAGLPWVANFEDLWSGKAHLFRPATAWHKATIKCIEQRIYERCDRLIANTSSNRDSYVKDFGISAQKITVVTLGYDACESETALAITPAITPGTFTVGYMGSFDKEGFPYRESLALLKRLTAQNPQTVVRFELCGDVSNACITEFQQLGMGSRLHYHGVLPHTEALKKMAGCSVLLLLLYETPYSSAIIPQKLFHYLGLRKPVLALAPEIGEVASILEETGAGAAFSINHLEAAYGWLQAQLNEQQRHYKVLTNSNPEIVGRYELTGLAATFAREIENCCRQQTYGPRYYCM